MKPTLDINIIFGKVNIDRFKPDSEIDNSTREVQINQTDSHFNLSQEPPQIHIDKTQTYEDLGLYGPIRSSQVMADKGMQSAREATHKLASWGDELQKIEHEGDPLIEQMWRDYQDEKEVNVGLIPTPPDIQASRGEVRVDHQKSDMQIVLSELPAKRAYIKGSELSMLVDPEPHIDITIS